MSTAEKWIALLVFLGIANLVMIAKVILFARANRSRDE